MRIPTIQAVSIFRQPPELRLYDSKGPSAQVNVCCPGPQALCVCSLNAFAHACTRNSTVRKLPMLWAGNGKSEQSEAKRKRACPPAGKVWHAFQAVHDLGLRVCCKGPFFRLVFPCFSQCRLITVAKLRAMTCRLGGVGSDSATFRCSA